MSEIKRVVIEDYPAGNLPEEVRGGIDPKQRVRVTVEEADEDELERKLRRYWGAAAHLGTTTEEAVARIRALRDEWD